jgi:hypothetical protein
VYNHIQMKEQWNVIEYFTRSPNSLFSPWGLHFIHVLLRFHVSDHYSFCYKIPNFCSLECMTVGLLCENVTFCLLAEPQLTSQDGRT